MIAAEENMTCRPSRGGGDHLCERLMSKACIQLAIGSTYQQKKKLLAQGLLTIGTDLLPGAR